MRFTGMIDCQLTDRSARMISMQICDCCKFRRQVLQSDWLSILVCEKAALKIGFLRKTYLKVHHQRCRLVLVVNFWLCSQKLVIVDKEIHAVVIPGNRCPLTISDC